MTADASGMIRSNEERNTSLSLDDDYLGTRKKLDETQNRTDRR